MKVSLVGNDFVRVTLDDLINYLYSNVPEDKKVFLIDVVASIRNEFPGADDPLIGLAILEFVNSKGEEIIHV